MVIIDKLNERLIELLGENARQSSDVIARKLKTSPATIRRRLRRLLQSGVLRIVAVADANKIGLPLTAIIAMDVSHDKLDGVIEKLVNHPEVKWVSTTTGRFDIVAITRFASTEDLADFVQKELAGLEGLRDSETFVCLHIGKGRFTGITSL
jgi:Lrp/AsnC family transcriptional regulator for asnA, asnC and gidA